MTEVRGYPLSSGATTRKASPSASAEHSASHFTPVTLSGHRDAAPARRQEQPVLPAEISEQVCGLDHEEARWTGPTVENSLNIALPNDQQ